MFRKYFCLFFFLILSIAVNAQQNWFNQKLGDKISISFPKKPVKASETSYGVKDDEGVIFAASMADIAKAINFDKAAFDSVVVEQDFANEFLEGFKPSMPKYTFGPVSISNLTGKTSYQFEGRDEVNKSRVYFITIFIDGVAYSFTCILPDGKSILNKNIFFKGITISK
ncbi:hypothetical protein [Pedobacter aquatilis]|uniref:hypothetical protein n=1 Tax=Pedobacter aquatilis TaxID=351343 RepID=UPI00292F36A1|nr:hypothetical protein [Pedobacter aquatilis]